MAVRKNRWFEKHLDKIKKVLQSQEASVLTLTELKSFFRSHRSEWGVPQHVDYNDLIKDLQRLELLKILSLKTPDKFTEKLLYSFGEPSVFSVAIALRTGSWVSHLSAAYVHQLTVNMPLAVYTTREQTYKPGGSGTYLTQESITNAFSRPPRLSNQRYEYLDSSIYLLESAYTDQAGVTNFKFFENTIKVTNLERTLIDLCVRPQYGGGVYSVSEAFFRAKERVLIPRLIALLRATGYKYPYHQSVGFYLEKAEYPEELVNKFEGAFQFDYDFYLTNEMKRPKFDERWRLYVPSGMEIIR